MSFSAKVFDELLTNLDDWFNSALVDLTNYDLSHDNPLFSKEQCVEFIQRALEKGVKISSQFFQFLLIFSDSNVLKATEVKESFKSEFIQIVTTFLSSASKLKDPANLRHVPCVVLMKELRKSIPSVEYVERSIEQDRMTIDALIRINVVAESDAKVYFSYSRALRDFYIELLTLTSNKSESFSDVRLKVAKLKEKMPKDDFSFLVYFVILLRLVHTALGMLSLFTPMKSYEEHIKELDTTFSEIHNELVKLRMDSKLFRSFNGLILGFLTISTYFPLCQFLGENYTKLKYPANFRGPKEKAKGFNVAELIESDAFFTSVSADLRKALTDIQSWSKFFKDYVFGVVEKD